MTRTLPVIALMATALSSLGGEEFLSRGLSRSCATGRIDGDLASSERGWRVLDELLATTTFEPNMVRLVADRGRVEPDLYLGTTLSAGITRRTLRPDVLMHELSGGATLTINGADRLHAGLQADREVLEYAVARLAWCNGFVSQTATSAFGRHRDNHDVVVVQAEGSKHWRVFAPPRSGRSQPVFDGVLLPGDVLHVPTGWDHEVTGTREPSLHWTFGFVVPSHADLVLAELAHRAARGVEPEVLLDPEHLSSDPLALDHAARARSLERRTGSNLPWAFGAELPALEDLVVRWAARLPPVLEHVRDAVSVGSLGRRYRIDSRLEWPIRALARGERVPGSDLVSEAATEPVVRRFLTWALEQRLILLESVR